MFWLVFCDLQVVAGLKFCKSVLKDVFKYSATGFERCLGLYFVNYRSWQAEICKSVLKDVFK